MSHNPTLAIPLFLAASVGKIGATLFMVPLGRLGWRQTLTIGVGLDARLTTEIVVARLLFDAQLIDAPLFTALVAAASLSAITVPVGFAVLVSNWGEFLIPQVAPDPDEHHTQQEAAGLPNTVNAKEQTCHH